MATRKVTAEDLQHIEELAKGWGKIIVRQQWGEQGPGLDVNLTQMEEVGLAAVRGLRAGTLESATQQQAHHWGAEQPCPKCGRLCPLRQEEPPQCRRGRWFLRTPRTQGPWPGMLPGFFSLSVRCCNWVRTVIVPRR